MRSRWLLIAAVTAGIVVAGVVATVGIAFRGGGKETTSKAAYQTTVHNARDRVDYALARITKSQSIDQLVERINEASVSVNGAASELDHAKVANGFADDNARLVTTLQAFSQELSNTASTFSDPTVGGALANATSLSFPEWDKVNAILTEMQHRGIAVPLLARH